MYRSMEVRLEDLPDWAQHTADRFLSGHPGTKRYWVEVYDGPISVGGVTDEYSTRLVVHRKASGEMDIAESGYYSDGAIAQSSPDAQEAYFGGQYGAEHLDDCVLTVTRGYKYSPVRLMCHEGSQWAALADVDTSAELSKWQMAVLKHYAGLNSKGRKWERDSYRLPQALFDEVDPVLVERGYITKNRLGAVTVTMDGRRAARDGNLVSGSSSYRWPSILTAWRESK